jgi:hypothetical protein
MLDMLGLYEKRESLLPFDPMLCLSKDLNWLLSFLQLFKLYKSLSYSLFLHVKDISLYLKF